jgi:uncharacterized protein
MSDRLAALRRLVADQGPAVVAYSGGVDSTLVLAVASEVLGTRCIGVMGLSPAVPTAEVSAAIATADRLGARLILVDTHELDSPEYVANPPTRCFHCKTELYRVCHVVAARQGLDVILNGTNADDAGDWRPGLTAAEEAAVRSPLLECGLAKADVRALARQLELPNWDKPAQPCLASRLPYGTVVTPERLAAVDSVEQFLRARGFSQVRARHHGDVVRLEVESDRVAELIVMTTSAELTDAIHAAGFQQLVVEPEGFRSGRLNDELESVP